MTDLILSHSQQKQFNDCSWQFYLQRKARDEFGNRLKPLTAAWFDHGTAVHKAQELWLKDPSINAVQVFKDEYDKLITDHLNSHPWESEWIRGGRKSRESDVLDRRRIGAEQVARFVEWWPEQPVRIWTLPDGSPALEVEFLARLGNVWVRGFIDAVWEWDTGEIDVVDWKTGTKKPEDEEQLGLYRLAIEELLGVRVNVGRYFMLRTWKYEPVDLSRFTREHLTEIYSQAEAGIRGRLYVAKPGSGCFTCTMKKHCAFAS
jgi:putative RecB family exonuclease